MSTPQCLTIVDAAAVMSVSKSSLYQLIASGKLKVIKVGRRTLVPVTSLRAFIDDAVQERAKTARASAS